MQYRSVKGFTGFGQLGMLLLFLGAGFIMAAIVQLIIGYQMVPPGTPLDKMGDEMIAGMLKPENVGMARLSQVLGTFFLLFVPAVLFNLVVNGKSYFWLGFNPYLNGLQVVTGFFLIFAAGIAAAPFAELTRSVLAHYPSFNAFAANLEKMYNEQAMALSNLKSWPEFLIAIAILAFFPAMFEEVFFRGALQNLLVRWWKQPLVAIIVTSLVFSLIHSSVYLFISRAILGVVLGLMYYYTKNIWVNIIAHFINNLLALIQLFYLSQTHQKIEPDKLDMQYGWVIGGFAAGALILLFTYLIRRSKENKQRILMKEQVMVETADPFRSFNHPQDN